MVASGNLADTKAKLADKLAERRARIGVPQVSQQPHPSRACVGRSGASPRSHPIFVEGRSLRGVAQDEETERVAKAEHALHAARRMAGLACRQARMYVRGGALTFHAPKDEAAVSEKLLEAMRSDAEKERLRGSMVDVSLPPRPPTHPCLPACLLVSPSACQPRAGERTAGSSARRGDGRSR